MHPIRYLLSAGVVLPSVFASPISQEDVTDRSKFCPDAAKFLAEKGALQPIDKWCSKRLNLKPITTTSTCTFTQPLTQIYGSPVITEYESPSAPGTATLFPPPVSVNGTTKTTSTSTSYTFSNRFYTNTVTSTKEVVCTRTMRADDYIIENACECFGVTTPTIASTTTVTATGDITTITQPVTQTYGPTTTYSPTATITGAKSTVYASTVTQFVNIVSTNTFDLAAYPDKTEIAKSCTATKTRIVL